MKKNQIGINSVVDFKGSIHDVYGVIKSLNGEKATLVFQEANHPQVCENCGSVSGLSRSGNTGEIECLITGCGHGHGFKKWEEEHLISRLILAPEEFQPKEIEEEKVLIDESQANGTGYH